MASGYSGTPLAAKLGYKPGQRLWTANMPPSVAAEIARNLPSFAPLGTPEPPLDAAHVFTASRAELEAALTDLRPLLTPGGLIWISWPKKASKVSTDVTEDTVRELALPLGFVDVKVCAVDEVWSGLKLVARRELRG